VAKNSIFELNGKAYDARSGALLGNAQRVQHTATVQHMPLRSSPGHSTASMDGMVASPKPRLHTLKHVNAHHPQPTKTLMRRAVKPPHPGKLNAAKLSSAGIHSQAVLQPKTSAAATIMPKLSSATVDPMRAHRARVASRSHAVDHFRPSRHASQPLQSQTVSQPVQALQPPASPQPELQPLQQPSKRQLAANRRPYAQPLQAPTHSQVATYDEQLERDLFEQALAEATSHEEPAPDESVSQSVKRKGSRARKVMTVLASLSVFVVLCGFVAYQNRQQIQLQMASAKAGFAASLPLYMPQGYQTSKMTYTSGSVAASFQAPGKKPFLIVQKKSNWDSQTLLDSFVAISNQDYRGFQSNGRTVYVIGKGQATWVNGGIWYQIKEANDLNDEQLVKIATSM
jgi:hypothetical protein